MILNTQYRENYMYLLDKFKVKNFNITECIQKRLFFKSANSDRCKNGQSL